MYTWNFSKLQNKITYRYMFLAFVLLVMICLYFGYTPDNSKIFNKLLSPDTSSNSQKIEEIPEVINDTLPDPIYVKLPYVRPGMESRKFSSSVIEKVIELVKRSVTDKDIKTLFENCFPNTLDSTISYFNETAYNNDTYTFVVTGDINAMWLRDSTNQVLPYFRFAKYDHHLQNLLLGVVNMQALFVAFSPYANAHNLPPELTPDPPPINMWAYNDRVTPYYSGRVFETKYELDSLAAFLKVSYAYWNSTGDSSFIRNPTWQIAVQNVLSVVQEQMKGTWDEDETGYSYTFQRNSETPTETLLHGHGNPVKSCGLVKSQFRPSDDATIFPYLIPANAMLVVELRHLVELINATIGTNSTKVSKKISKKLLGYATTANDLASIINDAIQEHAIIDHAVFGRIYAFEVDCYGSSNLMDDSNVPSLLALPYLGYLPKTDPIYQNTRRFALSLWNPWYFQSNFSIPLSDRASRITMSAGGVGGPHCGRNRIWPMAIAMDAITTTNVQDAWRAVELLKTTNARTGLMHEAFKVDDPTIYTRPWFAWANSLFGEMMLELLEAWPGIWAQERFSDIWKNST